MATEEQTSATTTEYLLSPAYHRLGQYLPITGRIVSKLSFKLARIGNPTGNVTYTIRNASDTILSSVVLGDASTLGLTAGTHPVNPTICIWKEYTLDTPVVLNGTYRISCEFEGGDSSNALVCARDGNDVKAGEQYTRYLSSWSNQVGDFAYIYTYTTVTKPSITTQSVTDIVTTTATGNGTIVSIGDDSVTQHGHCWVDSVTYDGGSHPPTTSDSHTSNGSASVGIFTSALTGLTAGTKYYVRAYATNSGGTSYGGEVAFVADEGTVTPSEPLTRVTGIRRTFNAGYMGTPTYEMELMLGGMTNTYTQFISDRHILSAVHISEGENLKGLTRADYAQWLIAIQSNPELLARIGSIPSYEQWVSWRRTI